LQEEISTRSAKINFDGLSGEFSEILIHSDFNSHQAELLSRADALVVILKDDVTSSNYLFAMLDDMIKADIIMPIYLVMFGLSYIDDAAFSFNKYKTEMCEMHDRELPLYFGGSFDVDVQDVLYSKRHGEFMIESFFEAGFHGRVKYINEILNSIKPENQETPFFELLAENI